MRKLIAILACMPLGVLYAQDNGTKYGEDSATCVRNISLFNEYYKMKSYGDALGPWRWIFENCPRSTKNIYIRGENMFKNRIVNEKDTARKQQMLDTLLLIYDQRIKYYDEEGFVAYKIGLALDDYGDGRKEEAYRFLKKSVDLEGNKTGPLPLYRYFQVSTELYKAEKINKEEILDLYDQLSEIIEFNLENQSPDSANYNKSRINIETFFGPFASCEDLVNIYAPRYEARPDDTKLTRKIVNLLEKKKCHESALYLRAAESLYAAEPSARSAASLARLHADRGNYTKASGLYLEAIDLDSSATRKALYNLELASLHLRGLKNPSQARVYARRAVSHRPGWGSPILLIGDAYIASAGSCSAVKFERSAVYWAAVDKYLEARSADPSVTSEANQKINTYSKYFPEKEDGFFNKVKPGEPFKIDYCWIQETTRVRFKD